MAVAHTPSELVIENLEVTYARVIVAVQGMSLKVPSNAIVCLLGTNGAGKSTTVRAITGFLPADDAQVKKGMITFKGQSLVGLPPHVVARRGVVLVPERRKIFETMSVGDNLRIAHAVDIESAGLRKRLDQLLQLFPILAQRHCQLAGYLSGGERQMLAIAQALMCNPRVLIIDELSLGLAPHLVQQLMGHLKLLKQELGISILLIEQDARAALSIADYGYIMEGGRVVYEGSADKLRGHQDVQEFYLGTANASQGSYRNVKQYRRSRRWWG